MIQALKCDDMIWRVKVQDSILLSKYHENVEDGYREEYSSDAH
jgi:hypothetical protein